MDACSHSPMFTKGFVRLASWRHRFISSTSCGAHFRVEMSVSCVCERERDFGIPHYWVGVLVLPCS